MKRILTTLALILVWQLSFAELSLRVEPATVQLGETLTLTITLEDGQTYGVPNLTPLLKSFTILSTERNHNYTIFNGQTHTVSQWVITLIPKQQGTLVIPALRIGQDYTKEATVTVTRDSQQNSQNAVNPQQNIWLSTEVNDKNPYVSQEVIYTVKLYYNQKILDADFQPPLVEDALLLSLGNGQRAQVVRDGNIYTVDEYKYAVFPQKSGILTIKPPSLTALIYGQVPRRKAISSDPIELQIKPIPSDTKSKQWVPAKQVKLYEKYDKALGDLVEGTALQRIITVQAVGLPGQMLPPIEITKSSQFTSYSEKPRESNRLVQTELVGVNTTKISYVLNKTGEITLPGFSYSWFNTQTGKEETATLPAITVTVRPKPGTQSTRNAVSKKEGVTEKSISQRQKVDRSINNLGWWLAGILAFVWLMTLLFWFLQSRNKKMNETVLLKRLRQACFANKATEARDLLITWANLRWPDKKLLNLADLDQQISDLALKKQIQRLSDALYNPNNLHAWQGRELWEAVRGFQAERPSQHKPSNPLPPINLT